MNLKKLLNMFEAMPANARQNIAQQDQAQELEFQQGRAEFNQAAQQRAARPSNSVVGGKTTPTATNTNQFPTTVNLNQPEVTPRTSTPAAKPATTAPRTSTPPARTGTGATGFPLQTPAAKPSATTPPAAKPAATAPRTSTPVRTSVDAMKGSQATAAQTQTSSYGGQDIRTASARASTDAPPVQGFAGADTTPDSTPDTQISAAAGGFQGGGFGSVGTLGQSAAEPAQAASATPDTSTAAGALAGMGRSSTMSEDDIDNDDLNEMLRLSGMNLKEKAASKQQQKFMGMVHAMQKGEKIKGASSELKKAAREMPKKAAKDYASTKHKGLPSKVTEDVMIDEDSSTLKHIANRFKYEVKMFMQAGVMDNDLYEALSDYYIDRGEVPYGVAKSKPGYPDMTQWVEERFYADMGSNMNETVMPDSHDTLSELARLAGLTEGRVDECAMDMSGQHDTMSISTNMSSDGTKNVTISAQGEKADELLSMLKLAGMHNSDRPAMIMVADDEEMMEEDRETKYANTPEEEYETIAAITRQGNDLNREKRQYADKPKLGDNPMATDRILDEELSELLDSVLVKDNNHMDEGLFGDSEEELQARSPQYKQLKAMEPKYKGTEYEKQLSDRISAAKSRAEMSAGEVMQYDPKTGKQTPKPVVPPEQYKAK